MIEMFTVWTWVCLAIILITTYCSFGFFSKTGGVVLSVFGFVIVCSMLGGFYSVTKTIPDITVSSILQFVGYWLVASLATGILYWVRKLFDIKKVYEERLEYHEMQGSRPILTKARAILASMKNNYSAYSNSETDKMTDDQLNNRIINQNYPPKFKFYRAEVLEAAVWWPLTLIWLIGNRLITSVVEFFMNLFRDFFDGISRLTFRS